MSPVLRPFRGVRYASGAGRDADVGGPSTLLAPPYDVIGPDEAEALRARDPHNAVHLVLPEGEGAERYRSAARRLRSWMKSGTLRQDQEPAAYVYSQEFDHRGTRHVRRSVFAALDLEPLDSGRVIPHEETHGEPKRDRLALTEATGAQLSAVFLLSRDPEARLAGLLEAAVDEPGSSRPVMDAATPDGQRHRLWRVGTSDAPGVMDEILSAASADPLLIADGHHRYETALEIRRRRPREPAAAKVLACVASARDPGLLILPTHRVLLRSPPGMSWREALEPAFRMEQLPSSTPDEDEARAAADGDGMVLRTVRGGTGWHVWPRREATDAAASAGIEFGRESRGESPDGSAGGLSPVIFDQLVLRRVYGTDPDAATGEGLLEYHRDPDEAMAAARRRGEADGAVFFLPPLELAEVWSYCGAGRRLPPKSTYFWPKVPSGLLFRRIENMD